MGKKIMQKFCAKLELAAVTFTLTVVASILVLVII